ncbi:hypothetical protein F4801DRAFT_604106 [Xylaria longipes]|nr:hypothetical protein F4801DRAFT_604106 [Xylaria longipes]RYC65581.1 hypothetical protein CHU98_g651 [Xylaria longipes]
MHINYGEGEEHAIARLHEKIEQPLASLLKSLNHGGPFTRVNNISEPSDSTFSWISDPQYSGSSHPRIDFLEWLGNEGQVFCITGLPGSGKSTIMKFLAGSDNQNQQTLRYLKPWATPGNPRILAFYFWLADRANIQNSFRGFLCHLLHQLLSLTSWEVASDLVPLDWLQKKHKIDNWGPKELERLLITTTSRIVSVTPLCFFIDALDEFIDSDREDVVRIIRELIVDDGRHLKIKFCVSLRPDPKIQRQLGNAVIRSLELHTATQNDIQRYVTDELERCWKGNPTSPTDQKNELISKVVFSARGVFLWVILVARKLREGIDLGDSIG